VKADELKTVLEQHAKWCHGDGDTRANLAGADLACAYLAGADLAGADLAGANLARAYLAGAYLAGANLARANLAGANLACADLAGAYLGEIDGDPVKITGRWSSGNESGYDWFAAQCDRGVVLRYGCEMLLLPTWRERLQELIEQHEPCRIELYSRVLPPLLDYIEATLVEVLKGEVAP